MIRYDNEENVKPNNNKKLVFGLIVIFLGAILLADNFYLLPNGFKSVMFTWQMLLIAIGCLNLFSRKGYFGGLIMILVGFFFLIPEIHFFSFNFTRLFWPVLLIAVGLLIIFRSNIRGSRIHKDYKCRKTTTSNGDGYINDVNIFGGSKHNNVSQNFCGGKVTAIFGGSELDLSRAKLAEGVNVLDMVCIFGGSVMIVPADWHVRTEVISILGGFADKRHNVPTSVPHDRELVIKGITIFGGGEIKSY
jgi:predicted membrane protein